MMLTAKDARSVMPKSKSVEEFFSESVCEDILISAKKGCRSISISIDKNKIKFSELELTNFLKKLGYKSKITIRTSNDFNIKISW